MALRRLWHMNPLFGEVCEMVEYGEDYTDAATVIEGMQTAYQVGKGYKTKAEELEVGDIAEGDVAEVTTGDVTNGDITCGKTAAFAFVGGGDTHTVTMVDGIPGNPAKS